MKLFIVGPTGAGKTTLASALAATAGAPHQALDELHWERRPEGDVRRCASERLRKLEAVVAGSRWVAEGVQFKWADPAIVAADRIIWLDPPRWRSTLRIVRRHLRRRLVGAPRGRATLQALVQELRWLSDYHSQERAELTAKLKPYADKVERRRS